MGISRRKAQDYADRVLATPRSEMSLRLRRGRSGVTLYYRGRALTKCHASKVGMLAAAYMARALGVNLPAQGASTVVKVPFGVLYRAIGISSLDLRRQEAYVVLQRLIEEADMQRSAGEGAML
ncbi:MAG: hypothetical protein HY676_00400 [Chloroflexi bacterium]|nr:hypothetical protein [Chloroflexota bacterium]